jgi:hypothetical protein
MRSSMPLPPESIPPSEENVIFPEVLGGRERGINRAVCPAGRRALAIAECGGILAGHIF